MIGEHRLDAIIAPSGGPAWLTDLINGDSGTGGSSGPAAVAGAEGAYCCSGDCCSTATV